jgi:mannose-1-phosphate guanylyltransferase
MGDIYTVIMAGGSGTRFWPLSRRLRPKQLLPLGGDGSTALLTATARRVAELSPLDRVLVVTRADLADGTRAALPGLPPENLLLEPAGRNTAPCVAWATATVQRRDPTAVVVVLAADAFIEDEPAFVAALRTAAEAAASGAIVTLGIRPTRPETGYGYLHVGDVLPNAPEGVYKVRAFVEKPDAARAAAFVSGSAHLWNAGIFVFRADVMRAAVAAHLPAVSEALDAFDAAAKGSSDAEMSEVACAYAGDIVAAVGLRDVRTGDTLADPEAPVALGSITVPEAVVTLAVEPKAGTDPDRLGAALARMALEDPSLRVGVDEETGQTLLGGVGELHLEIVVDRLRTEHRVEARTGRPRVAFRETLTGPARVDKVLSVQNGGVGLWARVALEVSPAPRDAGLVFEDATSGGAVPAEFVNAVRRGVAGAMARGLRGGRPVVDARVRLVDGATHKVDSNALAFERAGSMAFQEAALAAGLAVLEPVMAVEVTAPEESLGVVLGTVQSRRGAVREVGARGNVAVVDAEVPLAALFGYVDDLRGRTHGRASATMRFARYEACPAAVERELLATA